MPTYNEIDALKALDKIDSILNKKGLAADDLGNLCKTYASLKPWIETVLPLIERIPVVGKRISDAIKFLMQLADLACPIM